MWIRENFLEFNYCNNRLKLVLVTYKQFCLLKRCGVCYKMDFNNNSHVVTCFRVAREFRLCLVWRCVENDYAVQKHFWKHKLFIVIVFYKNIFCFEGAPSSYRVANLIALNYCLDEIQFSKPSIFFYLNIKVIVTGRNCQKGTIETILSSRCYIFSWTIGPRAIQLLNLQ